MSFTVAIASVTGRFGQRLTAELLKKSDVTIRGLVRDPSKLPESFRSASSFQLVQGDAWDEAALRSLVKGADVVICTYAGDDRLMIDGQKLLIDVSEAEGVPRFVASDYTIDYTKLEYGQLPAKDPMKRVHEYLQGKRIRGVHVLIGAFMDTFWSSWFGVFNPDEPSLSLWGTGDETWEFTSYQNAAEFVAALALDAGAVGFQSFLGDRRTTRQIIQDFEEVYNVKPKVNWLGTLDELKTKMKAEQAQNPQDYMSWLPLTIPLMARRPSALAL
ncbi:hypothetical protein ACHAPT_012990 [Fusarium lateritium]